VCLKADKTASRRKNATESQRKTAKFDGKIPQKNTAQQKYRVFPQPVKPHAPSGGQEARAKTTTEILAAPE
jgi:hypothetical protein